jgi:23S rRNA A1618 N6-methylase RlmF
MECLHPKRLTMEQLLINQLITLLCKGGSSSLIKDLIRETDQDGDDRHWTVEEIENANNYLNWINKSFGSSDAMVIINNLAREYNIDLAKMK